MRWLVAFTQTLFLLAWCHLAVAQVPMTGAGLGAPASSGASYTGPGDVVSGASFWGSCSYVYDAALANTSTSLCDLVSSASPTTVICTLRGTTSGSVDLSGYCPGSLTPATTCVSAAGGICNVSKVYDQTGHSNPVTNATAASQPTLTFNAVNGLPAMTGVSANATILIGTSNLSYTVPYTEVAVYERTGGFTTFMSAFGSTGQAAVIGPSSAANQAKLNAPTGTITATANDSVFHAVQGVFQTGASAAILNVDGTSTTGTVTPATSAETARIFAGNSASSLTGFITEVGFWPATAFSSTQLTNMCHNMNVRYGSFTGGC